MKPNQQFRGEGQSQEIMKFEGLGVESCDSIYLARGEGNEQKHETFDDALVALFKKNNYNNYENLIIPFSYFLSLSTVNLILCC